MGFIDTNHPYRAHPGHTVWLPQDGLHALWRGDEELTSRNGVSKALSLQAVVTCGQHHPQGDPKGFAQSWRSQGQLIRLLLSECAQWLQQHGTLPAHQRFGQQQVANLRLSAVRGRGHNHMSPAAEHARLGGECLD